jgi:Transaldolase/Fructose-6-phosphate aldolase
MNRLQALHDAGVSIWLDTLSRELLDSGEFAELIANFAVSGATSNPTIFAKAITGSERYDEQLRAAVASGTRDPLADSEAVLETREVRVDHLLVAGEREQQCDVDVDAASGQLLDRGDTRRGGRDLDHHVRPVEPVPEVDRLLDRRLGVVGEVGGALEGDESVAPLARVVGWTQQVRCLADVL